MVLNANKNLHRRPIIRPFRGGLGFEYMVLGRPGIIGFGGLNDPLLPQNPLEKVGGEAPSPFPEGFAVGGAV